MRPWKGRVARGRIDRQRDDLLGRVVRHLLDVHAAFGGGDEGDARGGAVDQRGEIELAGDRGAVLDEQALDHAAGRPGLDRHQRLAQHLLGEGLHLVDGLGEAHAALVAGLRLLELALAAAAGVDLRLHHPDGPRQRLRGLHGLVQVKAGAPCASGTPYCRSSSLAWYSWTFMKAPWVANSVMAATADRQARSASGIPYARSAIVCQCAISDVRDGYIALREAIISISTLAPIGSAATAMVERAG